PNPPGPDPDPIPDPNMPPTAFFSFSPTSGLFPLAVSFNAGNSKDSDGQITSYHWDFGDGGTGSGKTISHVYNKESRYEIVLRVTDDDSASATATGEVEVLGIAPPLNVQFQRYVNRNLFSIEYLYRITWNPNPRNEEVGAKIVAYKIYRREIGKGGLNHFFTLQIGTKSSYEYLDRTLGYTERSYEYAISAIDGAGRESVMGN
ncbi:MAG: PKD domain-containing protein, partial [Calditrichales bacterium]